MNGEAAEAPSPLTPALQCGGDLHSVMGSITTPAYQLCPATENSAVEALGQIEAKKLPSLGDRSVILPHTMPVHQRMTVRGLKRRGSRTVCWSLVY